MKEGDVTDHDFHLWQYSNPIAYSDWNSGRPIAHRNFHRSLQGICREAELEPGISAYELRHTAITLQAEAGHPAWQIADWAGTSERMITDVYRHKLQAVTALRPATRYRDGGGL